MKVLCISGHAQSGKDTSAQIIRKILWGYGEKVLITHNADLLKFICEKFFGWDGNKDERGRPMLQYIGTDVIRTQEPDFWVGFIIRILRFFPDKWDYVIIPDCRFPNEINLLRDEGFDVTHIRIERAVTPNGLTGEQAAHSSETALDGVAADVVIKNDGSIVDLTRACTDVIIPMQQEKSGSNWLA